MGGVAVSFMDLKKYEGRQVIPDKKLKKFPSQHRKKPGEAVICFNAVPSNFIYRIKRLLGEISWIIDCEFVPYDDDQVVVTMGAYQLRPGLQPIVLDHVTQGLLCQWHFKDTLKCSVIKGVHVNFYPKVVPHPNGVDIGYISPDKLTIMDLHTLYKTTKRNTRITQSNFRHMAFSPDGLLVAGILMRNYTFELIIFMKDTDLSICYGSAMLNTFCPNLKVSRSYTEEVECKFSPDSKYIAICSSIGDLIVVKKKTVTLHCTICPDIVSSPPTNARCFDFDPRYFHKFLTYASRDNVIHNCDIQATPCCVESEFEVDTEGQIDCIKFHPNGESLAVATSEALVHMYGTESWDVLYQLDGRSISAPYEMKQSSEDHYPTIHRLSFSTAGEHLAVSASDGIVRVWQLHSKINLKHLCRLVIKQYISVRNLVELPLPPALIMYLLQWPTE